MKKEKQKREFSKTLLIQESVLIWVLSLVFMGLAFYCIYKDFTGSLPWLAAMIGFPYTAYGVSQAMYYRKSLAENTEGGIKYATALKEVEKVKDYFNGDSSAIYEDSSVSTDSEYQI